MKAKDLNYSYGEGKFLWEKSLNFEFKKSGRYCIVGPSGVGKSTLLYILLGTKKGYSGKVYFDETELSNISEDYIRKNFAFYPSQNIIFDDSIKNNVSLWGKRDVSIYLERTNLTAELVGEDPLLGRSVNLSLGQKQRICLARTFYEEKGVIFLDEPFANIDKENIELIAKGIMEVENTTFLIVTHHLPKEKDFCNQIINIDEKQERGV